MLPLKHVTKHRLKSLFSPILTLSNNTFSSFSAATASASASASSSSVSTTTCPTQSPTPFVITQNDVADSFKTWFTTHHNSSGGPLLHRIYQILSSSGDDFSAALTALNLPLSEHFVLQVLRTLSNHGDILSCLKFFDWAGRQPYFHHTRATFFAIFHVLTRANLKPLVLDFLNAFRSRVFAHRVRFNDTLVIGYAIAGKPEIALHLFGKMRFQGLDLDAFGYHVLLNALAEENYFNAFDVIVAQIRLRGYETNITNGLVMKCLCRQGRLEEAEAYLNNLVGSGKELHGSEVSFLVRALCESNMFDRAFELVREFGSSGLVPLDNAYGVWIKGLVQHGKLDEALEFFRQKRDSEGYVPSGPVRYNVLIWRLLRENRLQEAYDLLMDMNESCIPPDLVTMNAVLCFFCKAGMLGVAMDLYNSRSQFGLSPNHMAYKYLILTLCWDGSFKEVFSVLRSSIGRGFFPDRNTFAKLADALCRECKVDEMKELLCLALERNITPTAATYDWFISALCRAGRVEDGYLIQGEINRATAVVSYSKMIRGFVKLKRGDIAARLLVEINEKVHGHKKMRRLYRDVICCLLGMDNPRTRVLNLLEMLTRGKPHTHIFNRFIDAAGHACKADLAREVFELMLRCGIVPHASSHVLLLRSYLQSKRISDALILFYNLRCKGVACRRLYNSLIVGLCKSNRADIAQKFLFEMLKTGFNPSTDCYEELVQKLCQSKRFHEAIYLLNVYEKMGRQLTSFLGNTLLLSSLISPEMYDICVHLRGVELEEGGFSSKKMPSVILGAVSGRLRVNLHIKDLEELIAKCFPLDIFTYNVLLRKATTHDMDQACELFFRICQRGYEPNRWTYDVMVHGFAKHGRKDEAKRWVEEMYQKGFYPTESTREFI